MKRGGYTLFELVVVISLVAVAATLAIPVIDSMVRPGRIAAAKDQVRGICAELRGRAMGEGRPYRFSVMDGTGQYRLEPDDAPDEAGYDKEDELPEQVVFTSDAASLSGSTTAPAGTASWRAVAVFQPDGTAREDATVIFGLPGMTAVQLKIRALTGSISRDDPTAQPGATP